MHAFNTSTWEAGRSQFRAAAGRSRRAGLPSEFHGQSGLCRDLVLKEEEENNERKDKGLCSLSNSINRAFCVKK